MALIDVTHSANPVAAALQRWLKWTRHEAEAFAGQLLVTEYDALRRHARSRAPLVAMAAVVLRARLRLAGSDRERLNEAYDEGERHYRVIEKHHKSRGRGRPRRADRPSPTVYHDPFVFDDFFPE